MMNGTMRIFARLGKRLIVACVLVPMLVLACSDDDRPGRVTTTVTFTKHVLDTAFRAEGVDVLDVNSDGRLDIAVGSTAYVAPEWAPTAITEQQPLDAATSFSDAFAVFAMELGGDARVDLAVLGFPLAGGVAREQSAGIWPERTLMPTSATESPLRVALDGVTNLVYVREQSLVRYDGQLEVPIATSPVAIPGHGLGYGDITGDGRADFLTTVGVFEATDEGYTFVAADLGPDCAQMHVLDIDGDDLNDVVTSSAHDRGVFWHEQRTRTADGLRFTRHTIDESYSQSHALEVADIDKDGRLDLVTGKRRWAHGPSGDVDPNGAAVLYWYKSAIDHGSIVWTRFLIDDDSGVGTQFRVTDVDDNGRLDIVTANKEGVFLFRQR